MEYSKNTKKYSRDMPTRYDFDDFSDEEQQQRQRLTRQRRDFDNENEERYAPLKPFERKQKLRQQRRRPCTSNERKWYVVIDVEAFRPEELKTKINPIYRTLTVSAKHIRQPWERELEKVPKMKRVVPLPKNVILEQLRVKYTPCGELVVKAPYQQTREEATSIPQLFKRKEATLVPVTFKDMRHKCPMRQEEREEEQEQMNDLNLYSLPEYLRLLKNTTTFPKGIDTEIVRDETTGQWMVLLNVNTVGFRREEIQVRFEQEQRVLLIEARHEMRAENAKQTIALKSLRREFVLPEWLQGEQMHYRIRNNGMLQIQLPCMRTPTAMKKERCECEEGEEQMWKKINKI